MCFCYDIIKFSFFISACSFTWCVHAMLIKSLLKLHKSATAGNECFFVLLTSLFLQCIEKSVSLSLNEDKVNWLPLLYMIFHPKCKDFFHFMDEPFSLSSYSCFHWWWCFIASLTLSLSFTVVDMVEWTMAFFLHYNIHLLPSIMHFNDFQLQIKIEGPTKPNQMWVWTVICLWFTVSCCQCYPATNLCYLSI